MAKRKKKVDYQLPMTTVVTVVARLGKMVVVRDMSYYEGLMLRNKLNGKGERTKWRYTYYEQGYCSIKSNVEVPGVNN